MASVITMSPSHHNNQLPIDKDYQQKLIDEENLNFLRHTVVLDVFGPENRVSAKQMNRVNDGLNKFYDSLGDHCAENNSEILAHCVKIMRNMTYESPQSISHKFFEYAFKFTNFFPEVPNEWSKLSWGIIIDTFNDVYNMDTTAQESDEDTDTNDDSEEGSE